MPPGLAQISAKAMSTRPSDRYATARALADDLDAWLKSTRSRHTTNECSWSRGL